MGLSKFNWSVLHDDGKVVKVYTENVDIALSIACARTQDEQPLAVIRGSLYKDDDAIDGADGEKKDDGTTAD